MHPWDHALMFNLGLVKQDRAAMALATANTSLTLDQAAVAVEDARAAMRCACAPALAREACARRLTVRECVCGLGLAVQAVQVFAPDRAVSTRRV